MNKNRLQLTLFVDERESAGIENIRREFNPEQFKLIKSHVTLCRENELVQIEKIIQNLTLLKHHYLTINFANATRFAYGKGMQLPSNDANDSFHTLRKAILQDVIPHPEKHEPHITLMHPRNSVCTDIIFEQIQKATLPAQLEFRKISLIEQKDGNKWITLDEFALKKIEK